jgi:hypothetical protein
MTAAGTLSPVSTRNGREDDRSVTRPPMIERIKFGPAQDEANGSMMSLETRPAPVPGG